MKRSSTQRQRGMRAIAWVVLSGSLLVGSFHPTAAAEPRPIVEPSYSEPSQGETVIKGLAVLAVATAACALLGCFDGDDAPAAGGGASEPRYSSTCNPEETSERPDTSIGCAWGDRPTAPVIKAVGCYCVSIATSIPLERRKPDIPPEPTLS